MIVIYKYPELYLFLYCSKLFCVNYFVRFFFVFVRKDRTRDYFFVTRNGKNEENAKMLLKSSAFLFLLGRPVGVAVLKLLLLLVGGLTGGDTHFFQS